MSETKRILCQGNEAVGYGAIAAGCKFFFGYPITPQNEIPAFFARELPKVGGDIQSKRKAKSHLSTCYSEQWHPEREQSLAHPAPVLVSCRRG